MKNIKKIICFFIILILTGCSLEYNLTINEDYSVTEKVIAKEDTKKMESLTRSKGDNAISYLYNMFKRDDKKLDLNKTINENNTTVTVVKTHSNIEEYTNDFKSDVVKKANYQRNDNFVTLSFNQTTSLKNDTDYSLIYDDIKVKIYVPFKVTEHNADIVEGNTYIWNINKKSNLKNIKITYDEGSKKNNLNIKLNNKTYNIDYTIIIISGIILTVAIIFIIVATKNKRNNSF